MDNADRPKNQAIDKPTENGSEGPVSGDFSRLILPGVDQRKCLICEAIFAPSNSRATTCSAECRRERALRYGAAYRQSTRDTRAKILSVFGGRKPTTEDLLKLIRRGKDRK